MSDNCGCECGLTCDRCIEEQTADLRTQLAQANAALDAMREDRDLWRDHAEGDGECPSSHLTAECQRLRSALEYWNRWSTGGDFDGKEAERLTRAALSCDGGAAEKLSRAGPDGDSSP